MRPSDHGAALDARDARGEKELPRDMRGGFLGGHGMFRTSARSYHCAHRSHRSFSRVCIICTSLSGADLQVNDLYMFPRYIMMNRVWSCCHGCARILRSALLCSELVRSLMICTRFDVIICRICMIYTYVQPTDLYSLGQADHDASNM